MIETVRLILRQWRGSDLNPYAKINSDPKVMKFFPSSLSEPESNEQANRIRNLIDERGWGLWAVELKSTGEFIGFVGLNRQDESSGIPEAPLTEIAWRLSSEHWGKGYAPEAAGSALKFAFKQLNLSSVYAFTTLENEPSKRVMQKIGMQDTQNDFNHPNLPCGHTLERHCLYKITREQWIKNHA